MKKAVLALAALFATAWAAPAMAAEFSYGGFMRYRYITGNPGSVDWSGSIDVDDDSASLAEYRVRQFFNLKVNDHVTTNVKLEWNSQFGRERQLAGGAGDLQIPAESELRIKNAFLRFDVPNAPLTATVGQQDFSTPKALISVEDGTGVKLQSKLGGIDAVLFWQRNWEGGDFQADRDNADWFGIVPTFKSGDITISPHLSYAHIGTVAAQEIDADVSESVTVLFFGVDTSGKLGGLGFTADLVFQRGEIQLLGTDFDLFSYIFDASVSLAAGPGTLTVKAAYSPGQDPNTTGTDIDSWQNIIATDYGFSPFFHDGSSNSNFGGSVLPGVDEGGLMAVGVEFAFSPVANFTLTPNLYYLMAAEDVNVNGGTPDDMYGIEAGVQANWKLWDAVNFLAQLDYLFVGDAFQDPAGNTDDAWRLIIGPNISW